MPPQVTFASALPEKAGKRQNHIFTQLDCVTLTHTMHLCAVFLKEQEGQYPLTGQRDANFRRDLEAA